MFSNLIIGLVKLEHKDENVGCKKISVGVQILENTHEEGNVHHSSFIKKKVHMKKMMDKRMMRMKGKE